MSNMDKGFTKLVNVLDRFSVDEEKQKRISREFQDYAYRLAVALDDTSHTAIYMRMAKNTPREVLEKAKSFVVDSNARSKAKMFMWKVKQIRQEIDNKS
jgi:hypothetical protein